MPSQQTPLANFTVLTPVRHVPVQLVDLSSTAPSESYPHQTLEHVPEWSDSWDSTCIFPQPAVSQLNGDIRPPPGLKVETYNVVPSINRYTESVSLQHYLAEKDLVAGLDDASARRSALICDPDEQQGQQTQPAPPPPSEVDGTGSSVASFSTQNYQFLKQPLRLVEDAKSPKSLVHRVEQPLRLIEDDEPIVRLTQTAYDRFITQLSALKDENFDLNAQLESLQHRSNARIEDEPDLSRELGQLRYQLDQSRRYKSQMGEDIKQKDIDIRKKELEIGRLQSTVEAKDVALRDQEKLIEEIEYLRNNVRHTDKATGAASMLNKDNARMKAVIAEQEAKIAELEAALARSQTRESDQTTRAQNLAQTQTHREKRMKQLQENLIVKDDKINRLEDEADALRQQIPNEDVVAQLRASLREKSADCDRQRNELKMMKKRYELAQQSLLKIENKTHIKGAAHLIVPNKNTKLPTTVLPCIDCFVKNMDCDSQAQCHHCAARDEKCARWRCSVRHITQECSQSPCRFLHNHDGWLISREQRSVW